MTLFSVLKITIAAFVISFAAWLSGKRPEMAGFITALPIVSILAIAFAYWQHHDAVQTAQYAKSIIVAVPISWLFFVPFFFMVKHDLNFWVCWGIGLALLVVGYFVHQWVMRLF